MAARAASAPARSFDKRKYQTIYPHYLDANLKPAEGRRLTLAQSVHSPEAPEIVDALRRLGFTDCFFDHSKAFPRLQSSPLIVPPGPRGCVRVAIKAPLSEHYVRRSEFDTRTRGVLLESAPTKLEVLRQVAAIIRTNGRPRPVFKREKPPSEPKAPPPPQQTQKRNRRK